MEEILLRHMEILDRTLGDLRHRSEGLFHRDAFFTRLLRRDPIANDEILLSGLFFDIDDGIQHREREPKPVFKRPAPAICSPVRFF